MMPYKLVRGIHFAPTQIGFGSSSSVCLVVIAREGHARGSGDGAQYGVDPPHQLSSPDSRRVILFQQQRAAEEEGKMDRWHLS